MKLMDYFRTKFTDTGDGSDLDGILDSILKIEEKIAAAEPSLEAARKSLEHEQAKAIDGDDADIDAAVAQVVAEQAQLDSLESLLEKAKNKGMGMVAADSSRQRQLLGAVEEKITDLRAEIDRRRVEDIARFATGRGLSVQWSSKTTGGAIIFPSVSLDHEEVEQIARSAAVAHEQDPKQSELEKTRAERARINIVIGSAPPAALGVLLAERRR